jgi:hypothetical protein
MASPAHKENAPTFSGFLALSSQGLSRHPKPHNSACAVGYRFRCKHQRSLVIHGSRNLFSTRRWLLLLVAGVEAVDI